MNELLLNNTISMTPTGQTLFTVEGTHSFIVPDNVHSICSVAIGSGLGQGGAGLGWRNHIPVTPGEILIITLGQDSLLLRDEVVLCGARGSVFNTTTGGLGGKLAFAINDGGGNGGTGHASNGRGGCGGYSGDGGSYRQGGSGGGGGGGRNATVQPNGGTVIGLGGGTMPYGEGANGVPGQSSVTLDTRNLATGSVGSSIEGIVRSPVYGGGRNNNTSTNGCLRIIWGPNRYFPNTNTLDM